ncbi:hypothetical protein [Micromonospora auratinigra]|uniref:Uncharacterized protein n=1 Tax=Micromonospora auratinigra TaxID=261654 RepID=A0A1A8ZU39_9ACTN|nr:hypothetical protein [Micromonospora auratinigra]SBT47426.1 hypothetical protein GA0070611_3724 [Micromonospora auratinigra]
MRAFDRLTAVVVALAFVLIGLGTPVRGENPEAGAVVTAAHRSIVHDGPSVLPPGGRSVDVPVTTPGRPTPPSGDPRAAGVRRTPTGAPSERWTALSEGPGGDHRAGVVTNDGPDDLLLALPVRVGGASTSVVAPTGYRQPAVPLPTHGSRPGRAPPVPA